MVVYYIKLKSRLSVCQHIWNVDISVVYASIETGLARNESCVFKYILTSLPTIHRQEYINDEQPLNCGSSPTQCVFMVKIVNVSSILSESVLMGLVSLK